MSKMEEVSALRNDPEVHYNCAQAVFLPFAKEKGLDADTAYRLAVEFGGGMGLGSVCGALTGALMALGLYDGTVDRRAELIRALSGDARRRHRLRTAVEAGPGEGNTDKKAHCDRMVYDAVALLESMLGEV